jgi:hypothetical protein
MTALLDKIKAALSGEPARAIGYGAGAAIYFAALAFDFIPDLTPDAAVAAALVAIGTIAGVIESIRSLVTPVSKTS